MLSTTGLNNALHSSRRLLTSLPRNQHLLTALHGSRQIITELPSHRRALVYLGTAAVVATGAGAAGLAASSGQAGVPSAFRAAAPVVSSASSHQSATGGLASSLPAAGPVAIPEPVTLPAAQSGGSAHSGGSGYPASQSASGSPAHPAVAAASPAAQPAPQPTAPAAPAPAPQPAAAPQPAVAAAAPAPQPLDTWTEIEAATAHQGGALPGMDMPLTVPVTASQSQMPMGPAQWNNATTIVHEALMKRMGLRSAVIAVATAMQESKLVNINYGTYDSLGLFQQRPSAGWGSAAQVTDPAYASDAFLNALHVYQVNNPGWVSQPVWVPAQGVQVSAFPYAYAQWEIQAANIVMGVTRNMLGG